MASFAASSSVASASAVVVAFAAGAFVVVAFVVAEFVVVETDASAVVGVASVAPEAAFVRELEFEMD